MKRLLAILLAMLMLFTAVPVMAEDTTVDFEPMLSNIAFGENVTADGIYHESEDARALVAFVLLFDYLLETGSSDIGEFDYLSNSYIGIDESSALLSACFYNEARSEAVWISYMPILGQAFYDVVEDVSDDYYNVFAEAVMSEMCSEYERIGLVAMYEAANTLIELLGE